MKLTYFLSILFIFTLANVEAQVVQFYDLTFDNIHISTRPSPTNNIYPATNYANVTKPLVAEAVAENIQLGINGTSVHPQAAGFDQAFFGGDSPPGNDFGATPTAIFTTATYSRLDFPITIESNFFNSQTLELYNESYFFLVPSNYQQFGSPNFNTDDQNLSKEGVIIGGRPDQSRIFDNQDRFTTTRFIAANLHSEAQINEWYSAKVVLDVEGDSLIIQEYRLNGALIFENVIVQPLDWLDDIRLGIAVDDLASGLRIETRERALVVDFELSDSLLCPTNCISINNLTTYSGQGPIDYLWTFIGADQVSSTDSVINQLCFNEGGSFRVELSATAGGETARLAKAVTVIPLISIDLEADTLGLCNDSTLVLDATAPGVDSYFWQDGSFRPSLEVDTTGLYIVRATNPCSNVLDSVFVRSAPPLLPPDLPDVYSLCEVDSITLDYSVPNALTYNWSDGPVLPVRTFDTKGNYRVQISNTCEELVLDVVFEKEDCCTFYAPNAFSPNQDGNNDDFQIFFNTEVCGILEDFQLQVFDRWGGKVFETEEINFRWNGRKNEQLVQPGAYFWRMAYTSDGNTEQAYGEILLVN